MKKGKKRIVVLEKGGVAIAVPAGNIKGLRKGTRNGTANKADAERFHYGKNFSQEKGGHILQIR